MNNQPQPLSTVVRRDFLKIGSVTAGSALVPYFFGNGQVRAESKNDRPIVGAIGLGGRGNAINRQAREFGDIVAVCDVDKTHLSRALGLTGGKGKAYTDYRKLLEREDIEAVTIATPDHWHAKIAIDAMLAGKDVYCEKPLTLTIDEGKQICEVVKKTGAVFQVGTNQRSEWHLNFIKAIAMIREGRIGTIRRIQVNIHQGPSGGPFKKSAPPASLDWDMWLGPAPKVDYIKQRCHSTFRWWYEYSGGMLTDWGAHHVDIAHWGLGMNDTGPTSIDATGTVPTIQNGYNTVTDYRIECSCPNDVKMIISSANRNSIGVLFEGDKGRFFVNRGRVSGKPAEELADNPLPEDAMTKVYGGRKPGNHMRNFFECVRERAQPISDVFSHHRALTTCHLANISLRLGRKLNWDPVEQQIVGDEEANKMLNRPERTGYQI
jgi:predicted dehydrogenase